jgi:hypothetical protein
VRAAALMRPPRAASRRSRRRSHSAPQCPAAGRAPRCALARTTRSCGRGAGASPSRARVQGRHDLGGTADLELTQDLGEEPRGLTRAMRGVDPRKR